MLSKSKLSLYTNTRKLVREYPRLTIPHMARSGLPIKLNLKNTKEPYQHLSTPNLHMRRGLYSLFSQLSKRSIGIPLINCFMRLRPLGLYPLVKQNLYNIFCGGPSLDSLTPLFKRLDKANISPLLNYGVEYAEKESILKESTQELKRALDRIQAHGRGQVILRPSSVISAKLLEKVQLKAPLTESESAEWARSKDRVRQLCQHATKTQVPLVVDAETINIQTAIHELIVEMMQEFNSIDNKNPLIYSTIQCYRKDSLTQLRKGLADAKKNGYTFAIKFVRGAYIEDEIRMGNREKDIEPTKEKTSDNYNTALQMAVKDIDQMKIFVASHNEASIKWFIHLLNDNNILPHDPRITVAQMMGMRADLTYALAKAGVNTSQFIPYGPSDVLVPYLVRRGQENATALSGASADYLHISQEIAQRKSGK